MKYGLNSWGTIESWYTIRDAVGPFPGFRNYTTPDKSVPTTWNQMNMPIPTGATFTIASINPDIPTLLSGELDDDIRRFVNGAAKGDWLTVWHEGESPKKGWTPEQIKAAHAHMYPLVKSVRPDMKYGQIVMAYSAIAKTSPQYPLQQWIAKRSNKTRLDFYGIDGYFPTATSTVDSVFGVAARAIKEVAPKAVIAVTEFNAIPQMRTQRFNEMYKWAVSMKCPAFFPFFGDKYPWDPNDTATINVMKAQVNATA